MRKEFDKGTRESERSGICERVNDEQQQRKAMVSKIIRELGFG